MADVEEECFDEDILFSEFSADSKQNSPKYSSSKPKKGVNWSSEDVEVLKEENTKLKHVLQKLLAGEKRSSQEKPLFNAIFFNNTFSIEGRQKLEFFLHSLLAAQQDSLTRLDCSSESSSYSKLPPSLEALNQSRHQNESEGCSSADHDKPHNRHCFSVINCTQYFESYCVDSCGFPLENWDPSNSEGWNIPIYEQVFFTALPCDEESSKVRVKRGKACFNCGSSRHGVSDCPEPQNLARIEAKRKEFVNKFSSPFAKASRYHFDEERFGAFKPGVISDKLREALGIGPNDVPPYIYKMRLLGYPPGYIPSANTPTLALYDADGNVDNYVMEDLGDDDDDDDDDESAKKSLFVRYPGFNCSLPAGVSDQSANLGFPPMAHHHSINNMERIYKQMQANTANAGSRLKRNGKKRKWDETNQGEGDMEIDEEDELIEVKRMKYEEESIKEDEGGYSPSHPGIQCGTKEKELLEQLHHSSSSKTSLKSQVDLTKATTADEAPIPCELSKPSDAPDVASRPQKRKVRKKRIDSADSVEDGEIVSDEEVECEEVEAEDEIERKSNQGWWLTVPLTPSLEPCKTLTPPPVPAVKLPMDLLTRFYTSSTTLHSVSFEDRIMWLDPIYGNIQVSSGRYDKLKEILQKRVKKRR